MAWELTFSWSLNWALQSLTIINTYVTSCHSDIHSNEFQAANELSRDSGTKLLVKQSPRIQTSSRLSHQSRLWADTSTLPTTYNSSGLHGPITNKAKVAFIWCQCDEEIELNCWSKPFSKELLPWMHSSPIGAIPKSTPGKYGLINNHSNSPHTLNSMIPKSQVRIKLDNIHDLGTELSILSEILPYSNQMSRAHIASCQCTHYGKSNK